MSTQARTGSPTARKVVGSLALIGTAAAVAGLGTYGTFTDSTTPLDTTVATGTLSIDLTQPAGATAVPVSVSGLVPGDSLTRAVDLVNNGDVALSSIRMASSAPSPSILTENQTDGLQLSVTKCSVAWTQGGTADAPTYTCGGTERGLLAGPVVNNAELNTPASLNPGGTDHLVFSVSLPEEAGNEFKGQTAAISLAFTGVSRSGTAR